MWWKSKNARRARPNVRPSLESLEERSLLSVTPLSIGTGPCLTANGTSSAQAVSADGRFIVIETTATDLVSGVSDVNGVEDLYLVDRKLGTTSLISHAAGLHSQYAANGPSRFPSISADGLYVAFQTLATNMSSTASDGNGQCDVYVWERESTNVWMVGWDMATPPSPEPWSAPNGSSTRPQISADGSTVVYQSTSDNLCPGDTNEGEDVFLYHLGSDKIVRVSGASNGLFPASGDGSSYGPMISEDGTKVAFLSLASNLDDHASDGNGVADVYLYDDATGTCKLVSHDALNPKLAAGAFDLDDVSLSGDGQFVAYTSAADLVPGYGDQPKTRQVFLYDAQTDTTQLVSRSQSLAGDDHSGHAVVSDNGRYVAYTSLATNLVAGQVDTKGTLDVFHFDRLTGETVLVSVAAGTKATAGDGDAEDAAPAISGDGRFVAFASKATNLVLGQKDANKTSDVFLFDVDARTTFLVSHTGDHSTAGNAASFGPVLSMDGSFVAFSSEANDLLPSDNNGELDAFGYDKPSFGAIYVDNWTDGPVVKPKGDPERLRILAIDDLLGRSDFEPNRPIGAGFEEVARFGAAELTPERRADEPLWLEGSAFEKILT
jgi:Tol biopolymer transport system component